MNTTLYKRLILIERSVEEIIAAPTFPIYDPADLPQDAVDAQVFIGTDDSINWFDGTSWNTYAALDAVEGIIPQDLIEGQIVIGSDNSLCWYSNGIWHGVAGSLATGNPPQDAVEGQLVLGDIGNLCWFSNGNWYGVAGS